METSCVFFHRKVRNVRGFVLGRAVIVHVRVVALISCDSSQRRGFSLEVELRRLQGVLLCCGSNC